MRNVALALCCVVVLMSVVVTLFQFPDQNLYVTTCDVGQGDGILIQKGYTQVIIDTGNDAYKLFSCLDQFMPRGDRVVELLVITHPDLDHYGVARSLLDRYQVQTLFTLPYAKDDEEFDAFVAAVRAEESTGMRVLFPEKTPRSFLFSGVALRQLWPRIAPHYAKAKSTHSSNDAEGDDPRFFATTEDVNDQSIVFLLEYGDFSALFTGDLEATGELALVVSDVLIDVDVLKVGHHGSKTSTTESFLHNTRPEIAVISAGRDNTYGHPASETLERLHNYAVAEIVRTDSEGTITIGINKTAYWIE
ncbi:MAG: MBL fold metallo-hydrolase [Pseudomonadales bacterium]|nr:MBL fold metallo-hydrolase [Candidatus Woesebacteria bacterium]MCB9801889.1 MBL fold metallo-hydrolase [Pseudomonadales bacterium]